MAYVRDLSRDVQINDTAKTYAGYTLYAPMMERIAWLVDMGGRIDEYLEPINLRSRESKMLKVKARSAALFISKIAYNHRGAWLEYSNTIIRGDKCRYHVSLK